MGKTSLTIYARLMESALAEPRETIRKEVERFIRESGVDALSSRISDMLKEAYIEGAKDGFRQAVVGYWCPYCDTRLVEEGDKLVCPKTSCGRVRDKEEIVPGRII